MGTKFDHTKVDYITHVSDLVVALQGCGAEALRRVKDEGEPDLRLYLRCDDECMTTSLRIFGPDRDGPILEIAWFCFDEDGKATYSTENCWNEIHQIPLMPDAPSYMDEEWMMTRCVTAHNIFRTNNASMFVEYRAKQVVMVRRATRAIQGGKKTDQDGHFAPYLKMIKEEIEQ